MTLTIDSTLGPDLFDQEELGSEILDYPTFSTWTGTPLNDTPTGWTILNEDGVNNYVTEHANGAKFYSDASAVLVLTQSKTVVVGAVYRLKVVVSDYVEGDVRFEISDGIHPGANKGWTANGTYYYYFIAVDTSLTMGFYRNPGDTVDLVYAEISMKAVTAPHKGIPTNDPWPALAGAEAVSTDFTSGWSTSGGAPSIIDADSFSTTGAGGIYIDGLTPGTLYRMDFAKTHTGGGIKIYITDTSYSGTLVVTELEASKTFYYVPKATEVRVYLRNEDAGTTDFTQFSIRPVQISWIPYGTNSIYIDETEDALATAWVDNSSGSYVILKASGGGDLSENTVIGQQYLMKADVKGATSGHKYRVTDGVSNVYEESVTTNWVTVEVVFTALSTNGCRVGWSSMSAGEIGYIRNMTIQAIDAPGTMISSTEGEFIQGIQWVDDDSSAAPMQDGAELIMTINGITTQVNMADVSGQLKGAIAWEMEITQPIRIHSLVVNSLVGGTLYIWTA